MVLQFHPMKKIKAPDSGSTSTRGYAFAAWITGARILCWIFAVAVFVVFFLPAVLMTTPLWVARKALHFAMGKKVAVASIASSSATPADAHKKLPTVDDRTEFGPRMSGLGDA